MALPGPLLLLLLAVGASCSSMVLLDPEIPRKRCVYQTSYDLLQAICKDLKLSNIPTTLRSGIEVLDARENRIRELRNDTLAKYTSLRYLYLQDNFLQEITEDAFDPTYYLEVLDLSTNGLHELPRSLFNMQSLRNLYLSFNLLTDDVLEVPNVRSPIQWLHLAGNKLTRIPRLSPLASVTVLNVSRNAISHVAIEDIAQFCSLQLLDLSGNPIKFDENTCECYEFTMWTELRGIKLKTPLNCPPRMRESCATVEFSNRTLSQHLGCVTKLRNQAEARKARSTWIWIASCIGAFMGCVFVALCCMHQRNRNKRERLKEQEVSAANNANTEQLLTKELPHDQA